MGSHRGGSNHSQGRIARRRGLTLVATAAFAHRSHGRDSASSANCKPPEELKPINRKLIAASILSATLATERLMLGHYMSRGNESLPGFMMNGETGTNSPTYASVENT